MGKILRTTKKQLVSATHPLVSYRRLAVVGAVVLGAGLIAAAPARADDDPTVGSDSDFSSSTRPAPEVVHEPSRVYYGPPAQRTMIPHRPYYGDRYYGDRYYGDRYYRDRYHRDAYGPGHHH